MLAKIADSRNRTPSVQAERFALFRQRKGHVPLSLNDTSGLAQQIMSRIRCIGKSDIGHHRNNNEDRFVIEPDLSFVALADGMGGAASGEVASRVFVDTACEVFRERKEQSEIVLSRVVHHIFQVANERILKLSRENPEHRGMGCTAELVAFDEKEYVIGHVGDSRTYILREGKIRQITRDHSFIQEQIDRGLMSEKEARNHTLRHVIERSVGVAAPLAVDLIKGTLSAGDVFMVCSDGLTDMVDDFLICDTLSHSLDLGAKADRLIEMANGAGGRDNITIILCEVAPN